MGFVPSARVWRIGALGLAAGTGAFAISREALVHAAPAGDAAPSDASAAATLPDAAPSDEVPPDAGAPGAAAEEALDEIALRDGRRLRGRVVQREPGRWIVVQTQDGRHHTFARDVVQEIDVAMPDAGVAAAAASKAWARRAGGAMTYELRAEVVGMTLPSRTFGLTGTCSTGTGTALASAYGQTTSDSERGAGGALGVRVAYMFMSRLDPDRLSSWWALRAGAGLDVGMAYWRTPVGIPPVENGELCSNVAKATHEVTATTSAMFFAMVPFSFGAHLGLGAFDGPLVWSGVTLGIAWAPFLLHVGPWTSDGTSRFDPLGFELTLDFTTLHALPERRRPEWHYRIAVSLAPSTADDLPTIGSLGLGVVWY